MSEATEAGQLVGTPEAIEVSMQEYESIHSSGPWHWWSEETVKLHKWHYLRPAKYDLDVLMDANRRHILTCYSNGRMTSDKKLIASAPELLQRVNDLEAARQQDAATIGEQRELIADLKGQLIDMTRKSDELRAQVAEGVMPDGVRSAIELMVEDWDDRFDAGDWQWIEKWIVKRGFTSDIALTPHPQEASMLTNEVKDTINGALYALRASNEVWIGGNQNERIDAALVALIALPVAPQADWSQAPDWAMWWAMDASGTAYWYEVRPHKSDRNLCWEADGNVEHDGIIPRNDWFKTLQQRPVADAAKGVE